MRDVLLQLIAPALAPGWTLKAIDADTQELVFIQRGGLAYILAIASPLESVTKDQRDFHRWCVRNDVTSELAGDLDEALEILTDWGALRRAQIEA